MVGDVMSQGIITSHGSLHYQIIINWVIFVYIRQAYVPVKGEKALLLTLYPQTLFL